ncbi:AAA family ATPase [Halorientalis brevis]|uniref:AAA family ATPase n=1 Tax=Halorientalis brevis TaxID=1126241 RepID=A0ABD6CA95_9EURY|nr:MoxR family ATPase [Halorientalis brevis]
MSDSSSSQSDAESETTDVARSETGRSHDGPDQLRSDVLGFVDYAKRATYDPEDGPNGSLEAAGSRPDAFGRWVSRGWITDAGVLEQQGVSLLTTWQRSDSAAAKLDDLGPAQFMQWVQRDGALSSMGETTADDESATTDAAAGTYKGLAIRTDVPDALTVPTGHDTYYERPVRAGKTELDVMAHALKHGNHLDLKGETGTGKSEAILHLAQQVNVGVEQVNFSEEVRMSYLLGHYEVYSHDGATEMQWVDGVLTKCMRYGGWFVADEHDMISGDVSSLLHSATEKGEAVVTIPEKGETITVHDDFRFIGTRNVNYAGSNQLNKAYESRLHSLRFEYLDQHQEVEIVLEEVDLSSTRRVDVRQVVEIGRELRQAYLDGALPKPITLRSMIRAAEFLEDGFMRPKEAAKTAYVDRFPEQSGHRSSVEKTIETYAG